jgi:hypothetical protein
MGWDVRLRPRDGAAAPPPCSIASHPDALTHARFLLGRHPGAAVEVRDAASGEAVVYRLTGGAMVRLGAASA